MAIVVRELKPAPCEDCGMGAVHHNLEWSMLRMESLIEPIQWPLAWVTEFFMPAIDRGIDFAAPALARLLFATGLAVKISAPDEHSSETAQALWTEAARRGIDMYEIRFLGLPRRTFIARAPRAGTAGHARGRSAAGRRVAFQGVPRRPRAQKSLRWIDDKWTMKKRFLAAGFPTPAGGSATSERQALALFEKLRGGAQSSGGKSGGTSAAAAASVIVKPRKGSGGRHTTVGITTAEALRAAYRSAAQVAPWVIVEEELQGPVFRATLVGGKLAGVLRRDPPQVIGDGRSTLRQLVAEENKNPLRRGPVFADILIDSPAAQRELVRQGLTAESIPRAGEKIRFNFKVNWGVGGTSRDATPEVHPDTVKLFEDIGAYLGEDIVGLDFIAEDISTSWREQKCGVIECNSVPLIGNHHFPYSGPVRNVAGAIWEMIFPGAANRN